MHELEFELGFRDDAPPPPPPMDTPGAVVYYHPPAVPQFSLPPSVELALFNEQMNQPKM